MLDIRRKDQVKKKKLTCRAISEDFKIGKVQADNVVKNATKFTEELKTFKTNSLNISNKRITKD